MFAFHRLLTVTCLALAVAVFTFCAGCSSKVAGNTAGILLFNGAGTSPNDVTALETLLDNNCLSYTTVNSSALNAMGQSQLKNYRLLIVPGGDFVVMGNSLTKGAAANIRQAVQHGLNYLGICAGAFLAGNSAYYNGFNLTSGVTFGFYAAVNKGISKTAVAVTGPGMVTLDQYWEDGPQLSNWGQIVATYPDATPAVTQGKCGNGFVVLAGIHPEAPAYWRGKMLFNTPVSADNAYAVMLISAALNHVSLLHN